MLGIFSINFSLLVIVVAPVSIILDLLSMFKTDPAEVCSWFAVNTRYVVASLVLLDWCFAHWARLCECHDPLYVFTFTFVFIGPFFCQVTITWFVWRRITDETKFISTFAHHILLELVWFPFEAIVITTRFWAPFYCLVVVCKRFNQPLPIDLIILRAHS